MNGLSAVSVLAHGSIQQFNEQMGAGVSATFETSFFTGDSFFLLWQVGFSYSPIFYSPRSELIQADHRFALQTGLMLGFRSADMGPGGPYDWIFSRNPHREHHKIDLGVQLLGGLQLIKPEEDFHFLKGTGMGALFGAGLAVTFQGEHNGFVLLPFGIEVQRLFPRGEYLPSFQSKLGLRYEW